MTVAQDDRGGTARDFRGYGGDLPEARWPGGARVCVSLVVNVEEGAELNLRAGDEANEPVHEIVSTVRDVPDTCMESHFEYGTRAGWWRVANLIESYGIPCTLNVSARSFAESPWLAQDAARRGWEAMCHGWRWEPQSHMDEARERAVIRRAVDTIAATMGRRPVGWHTKSATSLATRRLLVEEGGFLYDSNAYNDDLPYVVPVLGRPHVVLPYSFDTNDMRFTAQGGFVHARDFADYCIDAYDWLWREGADRPRMMTVGLHLRIIGRPGRISGLETFLNHVRGKGGAWFACREDIARHWRDVAGLPAWTPSPPAAG